MPDSLLGRRSAEQFLTDFLHSGARGAAVVIAADPGMGASTLLSRAAVLGARQKYRVFRAVGYRDEQQHEGAGLHQLLRPLRRRIPALPPARQQVARAALTLGGPSSALVDGALVLLADEARRNPVLLVVDDLHLFDATSVRALAELVERAPVALVAATERHRADAVAPRGSTRLTLEPLSPRDAALLLARQPSRPVGRGRLEVLRAAQGNPRAIVELSRIVSRSGAGNVRRLSPSDADALRQRFAGLRAELAPDVRRLIDYAATMTGAEPASTVAAAMNAVPPLDAAVAAGLLTVGADDRLVFCDPLLQVATYNGLSFADRIRINRDFCAVLPPDSLEHALHRAAATVGADDDTAAALERCGEREWSRGRPFVSTVAFQWAAELATNPNRAVRLRIRAIKSAGALGQTTWMGELAAGLRSADLPADVHYEVALALSRAGRQREAMDRLLEAFHHGSPRHRADGLLLAAAAGTIANASGLERHTAEIPELVRRASALPEAPIPAGHPLASLDRRTLQSALSAAGAPGASAAETLRATPATTSVTGTLLLAHALDTAGDPRGAVGLRLAALETMRADGTMGMAPEMWLPLISDLLDLGRWTEAADLLTEAEDAGVRTDLPLLRLEITALRAVLAGLRGDATQARTLAESVWSVLDLDENRRLQAQLIRALGLAALGRGEYDSAYRYFRRLFDQRSHHGRSLLELAVAAVPAGEIADASAVLAANRHATGVRHRAVVHQATALLADDEHTEANFRAALEAPGATVWVVDHALAQYHYGVWLRRQRRYRDARAQLKAALATFESVGIHGSAAMARTELQASGDDVDESPAALADLSPQQRQVVTLAAQGLRNKEIAAKLLLSPRTVGTHLYNAYLKLGIGTRAELRTALGRRTA